MKTLIHMLIFAQIFIIAPCHATQADDPFALAEADRMQDRDLRIPIPKDERKGSGVRVEVEKVSGNEITLRLLNDSKGTVFIPGHGLKSPFYGLETFVDKRWSFYPDRMNCGTGAYLAPLPSGEWFRFKVTLPDGRQLVRIRFQIEGERDRDGNRKTTELSTEPIRFAGEPSGAGQAATPSQAK
jgi:hypothetical protein